MWFFSLSSPGPHEESLIVVKDFEKYFYFSVICCLYFFFLPQHNFNKDQKQTH